GLAPFDAATVAAWAHGAAAEQATARRGGWRGTMLDDVLGALQRLWGAADIVTPADAAVLATLPALPGAR
ncbi:MAG: hypothetical protein MUF40_04570, partial [Gemmatimonadaceae bacterium]|nr:hypothetical protein [Gemmatimonadaceae bacterium]